MDHSGRSNEGETVHRIPLTPRCVEILRLAKQFAAGSPLVFPGQKRDRPLSNMVFLKLLERMKVDVTAHGFRSTFSDWAAETTHYPREVVEMALAHTIKNKVETACNVVRSEKVSAASREGHVELETILQFLRPDDELVVTRLDRLGRSTRDVLNIVHEAEQRQAFVTVLDPHVSTRGEMGHLVITVLGMVAQMERRFIKERQRDGIERAKAAGVYSGGKGRIDKALVLKLKREGLGPAAIAREVGCSRMQVYRILEVGDE